MTFWPFSFFDVSIHRRGSLEWEFSHHFLRLQQANIMANSTANSTHFLTDKVILLIQAEVGLRHRGASKAREQRADTAGGRLSSPVPKGCGISRQGVSCSTWGLVVCIDICARESCPIGKLRSSCTTFFLAKPFFLQDPRKKLWTLCGGPFLSFVATVSHYFFTSLAATTS